ncbi:MAG: Gfo/Idh/MocA family oxidoreductase [Pirellulales bacterium]|nr:Gfo/Idh/MocA family oxidoreductase [Pirellulales bacterium]
MYKTLIIGVGSIGERHLRCFQKTGRVQTSICEVNPELRERIASEYGVERSYASLDEALSDEHDLAVVATPAHLHIPMAHQLAAAGVHLLIEKPLSTTLEGIDALCELVAQKKLVAGVAYIRRADPALIAMKEAIDSGRFGKPLQLVVFCGQDFSFYRPAYRDIYYADHAQGGGAIQDALTHFLNAGEWLVGPINRLTADAAHQFLEGVDVEDTVHLMAHHGKVLGCYVLNQYQAPNETTITVVCEKGTVRNELMERRWSWMVEPGGTWNTEQTDVPERDTLFINQANRFLDALENHAVPACSLAEGLQTLHCNLAALESAETGKWMETVGMTKA